MIDRKDIWRAANLLLRQYRDADLAADAAHIQADKLAIAGDTEGCAVLREVATAVAVLARHVPLCELMN